MSTLKSMLLAAVLLTAAADFANADYEPSPGATRINCHRDLFFVWNPCRCDCRLDESRLPWGWCVPIESVLIL
jgi:hypothetical protein